MVDNAGDIKVQKRESIEPSETLDESILIFPNPRSDVIKVESAYEIKSMVSYSADGKVLTLSPQTKSVKSRIFDITNLANDTYYLFVISTHKTSLEKFVKLYY